MKDFEVFNAAPPAEARADEAVGFTMGEEIYVCRGEIACRAGENAPHVAVRFRANLFWLGREKTPPGKEYHFKCGTQKLPMHLLQVERVINASNLNCEDRSGSRKTRWAVCTFQLASPAAFDTTDKLAAHPVLSLWTTMSSPGAELLWKPWRMKITTDGISAPEQALWTKPSAVPSLAKRGLWCGSPVSPAQASPLWLPERNASFWLRASPRFCSTAIHAHRPVP